MATTELARQRNRLGLSVYALAGIANVSHFTISAMERGSTTASAEQRLRLSVALGVPVKVLWPDLEDNEEPLVSPGKATERLEGQSRVEDRLIE